MNKHEKLDKILLHLSNNYNSTYLRPEKISKNAGLKITKEESFLMLNMILKDGYVEKTKLDRFNIIYKGFIFIDNGGYTLEHKIYKRKKLTEWVSDYSLMFLKPVAIFTAFIYGVKGAISIFELISCCLK